MSIPMLVGFGQVEEELTKVIGLFEFTHSFVHVIKNDLKY